MKVGWEASRQVLWTAGGASRLEWSARGDGDGGGTLEDPPLLPRTRRGAASPSEMPPSAADFQGLVGNSARVAIAFLCRVTRTG